MSSQPYHNLRRVSQALITIIDSLRSFEEETRPWAWEGKNGEVKKVINNLLDAIEKDCPPIYPVVESKLIDWKDTTPPEYISELLSTINLDKNEQFYKFVLLEYMITPDFKAGVNVINSAFDKFVTDWDLEKVKSNLDVQKALVKGIFSIENEYHEPYSNDHGAKVININWGPEVLIQSDKVIINYNDKVKVDITHENFLNYLQDAVNQDFYKKVSSFTATEKETVEEKVDYIIPKLEEKKSILVEATIYSPEKMLSMADEVGEAYIKVDHLPYKPVPGANARSIRKVVTEGNRGHELYACFPGIDQNKYEFELDRDDQKGETYGLIIRVKDITNPSITESKTAKTLNKEEKAFEAYYEGNTSETNTSTS